MTKKIFSYSLFEPKFLPSHRTWDSWKNDKERYWFNIPTIILLNKILYPDYEMVFFTSPNIWQNPLSKIFECFEKESIVKIINRDYNLTEPAIWRMMPLWDREVDIFHARDVDSLPSELEYKYIKKFEESECCVGTIRSHENHYGIACRMLAGLCSFKPNKISPVIKGINFDFFYSQRQNQYGSDQNLLIETFTNEPNFTKNYFLDCKIDKQNNSQDFPCIEADLSFVLIDKEKKEILDKIKQFSNFSWLGQPCASRGELLNYLLELHPDYKEKIKKYSVLTQFYNI